MPMSELISMSLPEALKYSGDAWTEYSGLSMEICTPPTYIPSCVIMVFVSLWCVANIIIIIKEGNIE